MNTHNQPRGHFTGQEVPQLQHCQLRQAGLRSLPGKPRLPQGASQLQVRERGHLLAGPRELRARQRENRHHHALRGPNPRGQLVLQLVPVHPEQHFRHPRAAGERENSQNPPFRARVYR